MFLLSLLILTGAGCKRPLETTPPTAEMLRHPWGNLAEADHPGAAVYASCASCHMADGSGRADGTIPRLAGQRAAITEEKLRGMQTDAITLPVMRPFAKALTAAEITAVAEYLASLPMTTGRPSPGPHGPQGEDAYRTSCAGCHGVAAEGNDMLTAPRLCGQHAPYLLRRMEESVTNLRGNADPGMAAVVASLPSGTRQDIAHWLADGHCTPGEQP